MEIQCPKCGEITDSPTMCTACGQIITPEYIEQLKSQDSLVKELKGAINRIAEISVPWQIPEAQELFAKTSGIRSQLMDFTRQGVSGELEKLDELYEEFKPAKERAKEEERREKEAEERRRNGRIKRRKKEEEERKAAEQKHEEEEKARIAAEKEKEEERKVYKEDVKAGIAEQEKQEKARVEQRKKTRKLVGRLVAVAVVVVLGASAYAVWYVTRSAAGSNAAGSAEQNFDKDASYALGMDIGSSLKTSGMVIDRDEFYQGLKDSLAGKTRLSEDEAAAKVQQAFIAMNEKADESLRQDEIDFLAENSKKPGITVTSSGLQYEVISEGTGPRPSATDTVRVHYKGTFTDGSEFDSTYLRGEPAEFALNGVIPGWTEGIQLMKMGSRFNFYIPSELGYGSMGGGPFPPYSTLVFEVELLDIVGRQ